MTDLLKSLTGLMTTNGRIPRSTFWWFFVVAYGLLFLLSKIVPELLVGVLGLIVGFMGIFVQIKRWHDRNRSAWWFFIAFVPVLGWLWFLIECGFLKGTKGENRFGPDPLQF
jgi:uncharacterized membrane protein YhaH (DUF805 family)